MNPLRTLKNIVGRNKGYSGCLCCGDTWDWKKSHETPCADRKGMFPLCEKCYQQLTPEERYPFYRQLWISWGCPDEYVNWEFVKKNIGMTVCGELSQKTNKEG